MKKVQYNFYSYLIAFNNHGVTLLKQRKYQQAKHTFNEAFTVIEMILKQEADEETCRCCSYSESLQNLPSNPFMAACVRSQSSENKPTLQDEQRNDVVLSNAGATTSTNTSSRGFLLSSPDNSNNNSQRSSLFQYFDLVSRLQRSRQWTVEAPSQPLQQQQAISPSATRVIPTISNGRCLLNVETINYELFPSSLPISDLAINSSLPAQAEPAQEVPHASAQPLVRSTSSPSSLSVTVYPIHINIDCPFEEYVSQTDSSNEIAIVCHNLATTYFVLAMDDSFTMADETILFDGEASYCMEEKDVQEYTMYSDLNRSRCSGQDICFHRTTSRCQNACRCCCSVSTSTIKYKQREQKQQLRQAISFYELAQNVLNDTSNLRYQEYNWFSSSLSQWQRRPYFNRHRRTTSCSTNTDSSSNNNIHSISTRTSHHHHTFIHTTNNRNNYHSPNMNDCIRYIYNSFQMESIVLHCLIQALTIQQHYSLLSCTASFGGEEEEERVDEDIVMDSTNQTSVNMLRNYYQNRHVYVWNQINSFHESLSILIRTLSITAPSA